MFWRVFAWTEAEKQSQITRPKKNCKKINTCESIEVDKYYQF